MPKIKFKRGLKANLPQFDEGEPGYTTDTKEVFIGSPSGNVQLAKQDDIKGIPDQIDDLQTQINGKANTSDLTAKADKSSLGDLTTLQTADKASLVNAVNENTSKLAETSSDLNLRGINVLYPPSPLMPAKMDGVADDTAVLQAIFDYSKANGYVPVFFPTGTSIISADINVHRMTPVLGTHRKTIITGSVQCYFVIQGDSSGWGGLFENISLNKVGIKFGATAADYSNGYIVSKTKIYGSDIGISYAYNSWITNIDNCMIHGCGTGVLYDLATAVQNSGAAQRISNTTITDSTIGVKINGTTTDGADIFISNADIEHCDISIQTVNCQSGVNIQITNLHVELNNKSFIDNDGANIFINSLWGFPSNSGTYDAHFVARSGNINIGGGRIDWNTNCKFAKILGGNIFFDVENTVIPPLEDCYTSDTVKAIKFRKNSQSMSQISALSFPAGSTLTVDKFSIGDDSDRRYSGIISINAPDNASNNPTLRIFDNPGATNTTDIVLPKETGYAKFDILWTSTKMYIELNFYGSSTNKAFYVELTITNAINIKRFLDMQMLYMGTGTASLKKCLGVYV